MSIEIWADMEAYMGRQWKDPESSLSDTEETYGVTSKRDCPCDTCEFNAKCLTEETECSAMRNWCSKGDFSDKDIGRLLRVMA